MKSIFKVMSVLALALAFAAPASAEQWTNVENSFVVGFADNYDRPNAISWTQVAESFETGFNDGYVKSDVDSRVYMADGEAGQMTSEQYINNITVQFGLHQKVADLNWNYNLNRA